MNLLSKHSRMTCTILLLMLCLFCSAYAETDADLWASYQQPNVKTEGQAYLELIPSKQPVMLIQGDPNLWRFSLFLTETGGIPFTMNSVAFTRFDEGHNVLAHVVFDGNEFAAAHVPGPEYLPGETMGFTVNQPADSTTHYGLRFGGVDANGNECAFHVLVPLSQEFYAAEKPDDFRAAGEGSGLIELHAAADPVYLEEIELFGGLGWSSTLTITNVSDSPVELTSMRMIMFTEAENTLVQLDYDSAALAIHAGAESSILAPGESLDFSDLCPYQDMIGYGYRFSAKAQDGSTQTANCFYACVKEEKPE